MLKYEVDTVEGLDAAIAGMYDKTESGKYRLKVEGIEDTSGLKRKVDELLAEKKTESERRKQEESARKAAEEEAARKAGDVTALEKSWQEKLTRREQELLAQQEALTGSLRSVLVDSEAVKMASRLAVEGSADVLLPHIRSRLAVDQRDGKYVTVVLDNTGKPSAATLDELEKEITGNKAFAPLLVGSRASGGGAGASGKGSPGSAASLAGSREERVAALRGRFPDLPA